MSIYFIFDLLKFSYHSFDFWMEWIQKGTTFFTNTYIGRIFSFKYVWLNRTDTAYFIVDPLKSLYELFDVWMEWILEGAIFFLSIFIIVFVISLFVPPEMTLGGTESTLHYMKICHLLEFIWSRSQTYHSKTCMDQR